MIQKVIGWFAGLFFVFLIAAFIMRLVGEWAGDPLVPLLGVIFILLLSAIVTGILELQKQIELVKLSTAYSIVAQDPSILERIVAPEQKADLN